MGSVTTGGNPAHLMPTSLVQAISQDEGYPRTLAGNISYNPSTTRSLMRPTTSSTWISNRARTTSAAPGNELGTARSGSSALLDDSVSLPDSPWNRNSTAPSRDRPTYRSILDPPVPPVQVYPRHDTIERQTQLREPTYDSWRPPVSNATTSMPPSQQRTPAQTIPTNTAASVSQPTDLPPYARFYDFQTVSRMPTPDPPIDGLGQTALQFGQMSLNDPSPTSASANASINNYKDSRRPEQPEHGLSLSRQDSLRAGSSGIEEYSPIIQPPRFDSTFSAAPSRPTSQSQHSNQSRPTSQPQHSSQDHDPYAFHGHDDYNTRNFAPSTAYQQSHWNSSAHRYATQQSQRSNPAYNPQHNMGHSSLHMSQHSSSGSSQPASANSSSHQTQLAHLYASQQYPSPALIQHLMQQAYYQQHGGGLMQHNMAFDQHSQNMRQPANESGYQNHAFMAHQGSNMHSGNRQHDAAPRNDVVQEFRNLRNVSRVELSRFFGHIPHMAADQLGSRFIQTKLETATSEEKRIVFLEILAVLPQLTCDTFGNYVVQKLFEHIELSQKRALIRRMRGKILQFSQQQFSCRVIQKALELVLEEEQSWIVDELRGHVQECIRDQNGNHVIQKAVECCPSHLVQFVFDSFKGAAAMSQASNMYGCRVAQRCLEYGHTEQRQAIMADLYDHLDTLMIDQYGNYVVQHIVQHGRNNDRARVLSIVLASFEAYSRHKYASNVVERCIANGSDDFRRQLLDFFRTTTYEGPESLLLSFIRDPYANYVVQSLAECLSGLDYVVFSELLKPELKNARDILARDGLGTPAQNSLQKHIGSIEKKMHRSYRPSTSRTSPQHPVQNSGRASAGDTPALTPGSSSGTSSINSVPDDTLGGASSSRKNSANAAVFDVARPQI